MAETYDDLITRLRDNNGLDLTDVETEADLKEKLKNLTSKSGSRIKAIHESIMNKRLMDISSDLFDTEEVQLTAGKINDVRDRLNEASFYEDVIGIDVNDELSNATVSSRKVNELNILKANRASTLVRQEKVRDRAKIFLESEATKGDFRYYRKASTVADRFGVSEEQAISKIRESGLDVDEEGRIG